jgi:hypothetical protein
MKEASATTKTSVVLHPLCLLSVTDHYNRVAKDTRKRVVGVLLGSRNGDEVDVANSYGVPFEEDLKNPDVWFLGTCPLCRHLHKLLVYVPVCSAQVPCTFRRGGFLF